MCSRDKARNEILIAEFCGKTFDSGNAIYNAKPSHSMQWEIFHEASIDELFQTMFLILRFEQNHTKELWRKRLQNFKALLSASGFLWWQWTQISLISLITLRVFICDLKIFSRSQSANLNATKVFDLVEFFSNLQLLIAASRLSQQRTSLQLQEQISKNARKSF